KAGLSPIWLSSAVLPCSTASLFDLSKSESRICFKLMVKTTSVSLGKYLGSMALAVARTKREHKRANRPALRSVNMERSSDRKGMCEFCEIVPKDRQRGFKNVADGSVEILKLHGSRCRRVDRINLRS